MLDLTNHTWPNPHQTNASELEFLDVALKSSDWSHSNLCKEFETRFARYVGAKHALLVPSGTAAVYLALVASGLRSGQEVILPGITWPSVVYAIIKAGGVPRTVDISAETLCLDLCAVREAVSEKTFCILATHLFGSQCDMLELCSLADELDVLVIEDAAQSIGSVQAGKHCGTWGKVGSYSLNDRKVLACGEGGCVVTDDIEIYEELQQLQLIQPERNSIPMALPGTYKVSEFQAAVALGQLNKLEDKLKAITEGADFFEHLIKDTYSEYFSVQRKPMTVDMQSYFSFALIMKRKVKIDEFRDKLSRKINLKVSAPYLPISRITDFSPTRSKLAAPISASLRMQHENCEVAYDRTCFRLPYHALLEPEEILTAVATKMLETMQEMETL